MGKGKQSHRNKNIFMPVFRRFLCKFSISGQEKLKCDEGDQLTEQAEKKNKKKKRQTSSNLLITLISFVVAGGGGWAVGRSVGRSVGRAAFIAIAICNRSHCCSVWLP